MMSLRLVFAYVVILSCFFRDIVPSVAANAERKRQSYPISTTTISSTIYKSLYQRGPSSSSIVQSTKTQQLSGQMFTVIEITTRIVSGPCEPTAVVRQAGTIIKARGLNKELEQLTRRSKAQREITNRSNVKNTDFITELCALLLKYKYPPCSTLTITSTSTIPGPPCPTGKSQECPPSSPRYQSLFFDDIYSFPNLPLAKAIVYPNPIDPYTAFTYKNFNFSTGWNLFHCQADELLNDDLRAKTCSKEITEGDYFISLLNQPYDLPVSTGTNITLGILPNRPIPRSITILKPYRYFQLQSLLLSAFPLLDVGDGVVTIVITGYTTKNRKTPAFVDTRYIRPSQPTTLLEITYELNFFNLERIEIVGVDGVWSVGDGMDWIREEWEGRGMEVWIDDLKVCRFS